VRAAPLLRSTAKPEISVPRLGWKLSEEPSHQLSRTEDWLGLLRAGQGRANTSPGGRVKKCRS